MAKKKTVIKKRAQDTSAAVMLIISGILLLISIISVYMTIGEYNEKVKELEKAKQATLSKQRDLEGAVEKATSISSKVGWLSRDERAISAGDVWNNHENLKGFLNRTVAYLAESYQITDYEPWPDKDTPKKPLNLQILIDLLERLAKQNVSRNDELIAARNNSWKMIVEIVGTKDERGELYKNIDQKTQEITRMREDIVSLEKDTQRIISQGELDVAVLQEGIKQIDTTITEKTKEGEAKIAELSKKKKEYEDRLEKLRTRMELESEGIEIDGKVILADIGNNSVCIDLGAKDAVIKGMDFAVFTIIKGGLKKEKGRVKISKVFDDYCQASIIPDTMKGDDPITADDLVNSDVYNRQRAKTFIFTGTPVGKYLLDDIKRKIKEFGGEVLTTLTDNITYVVVGKDFEEDENYKKAIYLGAVVLREKELYDLLRIEWKE
ncbi:MAG: BRCT domain-containing protein [Planctomycetota bacterium]